MSNSTFQSLLMESGGGLTPITYCSADGPTFEEGLVDATDLAMNNVGFVYTGTAIIAYRTTDTSSTKVYRSTNRGVTWTTISVGFSIQDVRIAFYLGGIITLVKGSSTSSRTIYRSTDDGLTWTQNTTALPSTAFYYGLSTDDNSTIAGLVWSTTSSVISVNGGSTWSNAGTVPSRQWNGGAYLNGNYFCAARNNNEVYWSQDSGSTWALRSTLPSLPSVTTGYTSLQNVNGTLLAYSTTASGSSKEYYALSTDEGATWTQYQWPYALTAPNAVYWTGQGCYVGYYRNLTNIHIVLSLDLINWYEAVDSPITLLSGGFNLIDAGGQLVGGNMGTLASVNKVVYGYCPGSILPTSGRDYPRGEAATIQTGQITLANHYQPLSGQRVFVDQGGIGLAQYPLPSGNTATYTVTKTLASSAATTTTVQGRLTWGTDGTFTFVNPENGVGTTTTWLNPTGAGASDEYEFRLEIIDNPNNVVTPYSLPFEQYNEVAIDQIIPAYTDITLAEDEGSKTHTLQLQVDIKPKAGSAVAGQPGYVDSWLLTLNFLLTKPAIPVPVYPDFDSGTKINSESGNVFTWYFNPNGTITSGAINGTQVGRWIDAFDDVAKAAEYRLVVYSDPLPGGFQRVAPTTLIGANMGTSARVRHFNSGSLGSDLYVGFTLRIYPLVSNPRYNESGYFGQYTFTMVIPQISGF